MKKPRSLSTRLLSLEYKRVPISFRLQIIRSLLSSSKFERKESSSSSSSSNQQNHQYSEELVLPKDKKWPFLLRFPVSSFGMCLGVSSQAILWKTLATSSSVSFLHVSLDANLILWCISLALIYGQWMSGGQRRLSKVANPTNHLSIVGNFVGALLGATMGLKEGPIFFYAVGFAHYAVLFVTLYQRLPTNETLPKELHPVSFLFVAAPSVASMAWAKISGDFGYGSRIAYFIALFLYFSLAVRINFFRGFRFSLASWA